MVRPRPPAPLSDTHGVLLQKVSGALTFLCLLPEWPKRSRNPSALQTRCGGALCPIFSVTFQNEPNVPDYFLHYDCAKMREEAGFEHLRLALSFSFSMQLFPSLFMWTAECNDDCLSGRDWKCLPSHCEDRFFITLSCVTACNNWFYEG